MKKILITGGSGFIGRNLREQLAKNYEIIASSSSELNLLETKEVHNFLSRHCFDVVIHSTTHNATRNSDKDLGLVLKNNLLMFYNLARCNKLFGRMIYFGSGAEYNKEKCPPKVREDQFGIYVPRDDYGFSKYISALATEKADNIYDLALFGCFGKYEDWEIRFISNACCKAIFNLDITIKQNVYFDYLYIDDLVKIVDWFINANNLSHKRYNICTSALIDLVTLGRKVKNISGKKINIITREEGFGREYSGNNDRLMKEMGGFQFASIDEAIENLYQWYEANKLLLDKKLLLFDK